ncbi:MAG TPA: response regulator, partial [Halanaerobiales bacterium]|nr:response regulator [Halanaerobiales bacterium]HQD03390.1 response regulator [Halanaerobiales bacterium]
MRKVLVIDDEESIRELIRFNLEMAGFSVELAADGQEGLDKLDDSIDLVILDLMLPVLDGLTVCKITWGELELNTASHEVRK